MGMGILTLRQENLEQLLAVRGDARRLAEDLDVPEAYVSQMKLGTRPINENMARAIEAAKGLPPYSMDGPDLTPPSSVSAVDANVLYGILSGINEAVKESGLTWGPQRVARLAANLYAVYQKTGAYPDPKQATLLVDLGHE